MGQLRIFPVRRVNHRKTARQGLAGLAFCLALGGCAGFAEADAAPKPQAKPTPPVLAEIRIEFKLDPALTRGLSMGDRWVSPATFTNVRQPGNQGTVVARAVGLDHRGRLMIRRLEAEWLPADPDMVAVAMGEGSEVKITIRGAGESSLRVTAGAVSRTLTIKATYQDNMTQAEVSQ